MHLRNSHVLVHVSLTILLTALFVQTVLAQQSPREQLNQYMAELQRNPSDDRLREKIINLVLTLDPKPVVPDDAAVAAAKGKTIFGHAAESGSKDDLKVAADAFARASLSAPWVADYYFNQGSALEKAGQSVDAIRAFNFYLLAAPNAPDKNDVRGRIEGIRYDKDKEATLCVEIKQAKASFYSQILGRANDEDTVVELEGIDTTYSTVLDLKDMGRQPTNDYVGLFGWRVGCPTKEACSSLSVHKPYSARVHGGALLSIKNGDRLIDFHKELYQGLFFPKPTWTDAVRKAWSRASGGNCD